MYYYKVKVEPKGTPKNNFTLVVDGFEIVSLTPNEVGSGVRLTFASYRPPRFFGFPQSTHTLATGFTADSPKYSIMAMYPSRKWLSYTGHVDSAEYDITIEDVGYYEVVNVEEVGS